MAETKSLVLEHRQALRNGQDDVRADLREIRMPLRAMDEQLRCLEYLVSVFVTNDGEVERIKNRLDLSEGQQ